MTRGSLREYTEAVRDRYRRASKREKGRRLDEFTEVTGCHRKAAVRMLRRGHRPRSGKRRGRPRKYGAEVGGVLKKLWEASDYLCSKRLHPFIPELVDALERHGEISMRGEVKEQLCQLSAASIDRLLKPWRHQRQHRPLGGTRPGSLLKKSIPIRTFADWEESRPGFLEADLVHHCGDSAEGFYLTTLSAVDVATGWVECRGVWGKGQERVGAAVHRIRQQLPFPLLGLDSDNGGEFINERLYTYCQKEGITFTRSRSYKKNDSCHVEQKNWTVVRRVIGYERYKSQAALEALNRVYDVLRCYVNFFQPVMKLIAKRREGSKIRKVYDKAKTPYQRVIESGVLTEAKAQQLAALYQSLNPVALLGQLDERLERLWALAQLPVQQTKTRGGLR